MEPHSSVMEAKSDECRCVLLGKYYHPFPPLGRANIAHIAAQSGVEAESRCVARVNHNHTFLGA